MPPAEFEEAAALVQQLKVPLLEEEQLEQDGLYQQATFGEWGPGACCNRRAKAKWEAWNRWKGMSEEEAMKAFVAEELRKKHSG